MTELNPKNMYIYQCQKKLRQKLYNREYHREYQKIYREKNKEKINEKKRLDYFIKNLFN